MAKHVITQFTTSEPFLKIGTEIFSVDLSGLIVESLYSEMTRPCIEHTEVLNIAEACEEHIREQQEAGVPLVVDSEPKVIGDNRWFTNEYYIRVHLKNEPRLHYYIMNPIPHWEKVWVDNEDGTREQREVRTLALTFKSHMKYLDYIWDVEACRSCGY